MNLYFPPILNMQTLLLIDGNMWLLQVERTPLYWACDKGCAEVAKVLLEHGADIAARDKVSGDTYFLFPHFPSLFSLIHLLIVFCLYFSHFLVFLCSCFCVLCAHFQFHKCFTHPPSVFPSSLSPMYFYSTRCQCRMHGYATEQTYFTRN